MSSGDESSFYGIQIPAGTIIPEDVVVEAHYTDKIQALKILKKIKPARMKKFSTSKEAEDFHNSDDAAASRPAEQSGTGVSVESLPFGSVRIQDLVKLRMAVEKGNIDKIRELVDSNPRYLIASGDTPTILQERFRYNSLHSAAIKGQAAVAEVILNYISDLEFYSRPYPSDSEESRQNRLKFVLDLYLNTPDKGFNETPLHFAAKYGHLAMVELLVNEPSVEKNRVNKDGLKASEIVCTRANNSHNKQKIIECIKGQFYIPLYRSETDDEVPVIGQPWTPDPTNHDLEPGVITHDPEDPFSSPSVESSNDLLSNITSPIRSAHQFKLPQINMTTSPLFTHSSPRRLAEGHDSAQVVKAMAGPMSPQQAVEFRKTWASPGTPRRHGSTPGTPGRHRLTTDPSRTDPYKGLEVIGRSVADEMKVPWLEYWDFLGCSVDIRQPEGLQKLDEYITALESKVTSEEAAADKSAGSGDSIGNEEVLAKEIVCTPVKIQKETKFIVNMGGQGDAMNTTDDQLSSMFDALTIHSPTSPYHVSQQQIKREQSQQQEQLQTQYKPDFNSTPCNGATTKGDSKVVTKDTIQVEPGTPKRTLAPRSANVSGVSGSQPSTPSKRNMIEYMVPSLAVYMDKLRSFWPFGRGGFSPAKHTSSSGDESDDGCPDTPGADPVPSTPPRSPGHTDDSEVEMEAGQLELEKPRPRVYLTGAKPCKVDKDVLRALQDADIDEEAYPAVNNWYRNVTSHPSQAQESWPSPVVIRHRARLKDWEERTTPSKPNGAGFSATPKRLSDVRTNLSLDY